MKKIPVWISVLLVCTMVLSFSGGSSPVNAQQRQENLAGAGPGGEAPPLPEVGTVYPAGGGGVSPDDTGNSPQSGEGISPEDIIQPLSEGFESGTLGLFYSSVPDCTPGACGWVPGNPSHSGVYSAFAPDVNGVSDQRLILSDAVAIPANATAARLNFWHSYNLEDGYDGGILEISPDGGYTWTQVTSFLAGGYTGVISSCCGNPLAGLPAWTGTHPYPYFGEVRVDLLPYAGHNLLFRFRMGTDNSVNRPGWWIDDISLTIAAPLDCRQAAWMRMTPYPIPSLDAAVTMWDGMLYSFGGGSNGTEVADAYRYDPQDNTWTALAPLPAARDAASAVTDGTYIYILGGWDSIGNATNTMYRYNPSMNTYQVMASYSQVTAGQAAVYLNGKIYRIGGCTTVACDPTTASMEVYNVGSNSWTTAASLLTPGAWQMAVAHAGYIYAAGGVDASTSSMKTYRYNPAINTWSDSAIADLSVGRWGSASDFSDGRWVLAGGYVNDAVSASTIAWDPSTGGWSVLPDMLQAQARTRGATVGAAFYMVGGRKPGDFYTGSTDIQRYLEVPCQACESTGWVRAANYPQSIVRYGFGQVGDEFYIFGGVNNGSMTNTVRKYNIQTDTWTDLAPLPQFGEALSAAYWDGKFYVTQGSGGPAFQVYDIATNSWSNLAPIPASDSYGAAIGAFNGFVYLVGGHYSQQNTYLYQISSNTWVEATPPPAPYYLGGYTQVGQYLYQAGSFSNSPLDKSTGLPVSSLQKDSPQEDVTPEANSTVTMRLDMQSGIWSTGPTWTMARADFALATDGYKLYAIGGDTPGGSYFDSSSEVDELLLASWPTGTWVPSPADLPSARQANQAGFYSNGCSGGEIWSTGGVNPAWLFMSDHIRRTVTDACQSNICPGTVTISGSLAPGDLTASQRIFRDGAPTSCGIPDSCSVVQTGSFLYDQYPLVNNTGIQQCLTITATAGPEFIHFISYNGSFDPNNVCTNYLGDIGTSPSPTGSYSHVVEPGQTFMIVVEDVYEDAAFTNYDMTITADRCFSLQYLPVVEKNRH
jgi:N-acetylneuraminic acid mutarotase